ncbi:MAG: hypothetical protein KME08_21465 [Aphanothece sp. CMT-3BRIN-NPC111]|jgi:hypothetical protein|nr:hypothetical protein [Aphanothece sp. CMT-3BRIN-NPC111]
MQHILSVVGQAFRKTILILSLISLLGLSNSFIFASQPAYAAKLTPEEKIDRAHNYSGAAGIREESYEEEVEEAKSPAKMEKAYEEDLKEYRESQPDKGGLVEGAKELVEKVTGK